MTAVPLDDRTSIIIDALDAEIASWGEVSDERPVWEWLGMTKESYDRYCADKVGWAREFVAALHGSR